MKIDSEEEKNPVIHIPSAFIFIGFLVGLITIMLLMWGGLTWLMGLH